MKRCPQCNHVEADNALTFCRADGTPLIRDSGSVSEGVGTLKFSYPAVLNETKTRILPPDPAPAGAAPVTEEGLSNPTAPTTVLPAKRSAGGTEELSKPKASRARVLITAAVLVVILAGLGYYLLSRKTYTAIESIAVLPFENGSGDVNLDYFSDGVSESVIDRLATATT